MSYLKPPPRPTGSDEEATWIQWAHDQLAIYGRLIDSPGIRFEHTSKGIIPRISFSGGGTGSVLYVRVCKRDGTEQYIPFIVAGAAVDEADIPEGASIYDPTPT